MAAGTYWLALVRSAPLGPRPHSVAYLCAIVHYGVVISTSKFSLLLLSSYLHDLRHETAALLYCKSPAIVYFPQTFGVP
jgi:hypothetical protein